MGAGRPTVVNESVLRKLDEAFIKGLSDREACLYADIAPSTLYKYCDENKDYSERKELLKEQVKMKAKINVAEKIGASDINASYWYLERKARDEGFGFKHDIDLKSNNTNTNIDLDINLFAAKATPEELANADKLTGEQIQEILKR